MKRALNIGGAVIIYGVTLLLAVLVCTRAIDLFEQTLDLTKGLIIVLCIVGFLLGFFIVPLVHELGHLIFGLFSKMAFYSMKVAFLVFYKESGKLKVRFSLFSQHAGSCEMIPKNSKNLYNKFMVMVLGGSIFTALYLVLSILFFVNSADIYLYMIFAPSLPVAAYLLLVNLIPMSANGVKTDGGVILGLIKKDAPTMATINLLTVQSHYFMGKTPSQVDEKLYFDTPVLEDSDVINIMLLNYRYIYYLDNGDSENSSKLALKMYSLTQDLYPNLRDNINSDVLYESCKNLKDDKLTDKLFDGVKRYLHLENTATNLRIRAAHSMYRLKAYEEAREFINRGIDEAKKSGIKGIGIFESKLLNALKDELTEIMEKESIKKKQEYLKDTRIF